jgi:branched-chain amino acid transport system permease protein
VNARVAGIPVSTILIAIAAAVVFFGVPLTTGKFQTFEFANVAAFVIAILGLNILTGYSGQISLGNGAFMAIGGYTTALLVAKFPLPGIGFVPYGFTIPLAGLLAGLFGFLIGIPALRLRGIYLALATFALALAMTPVLNNYDSFTGGHAGIFMKAVPPPLGLDLSNEQWIYFMDWAIAIVLYIPAFLLLRTRTGRAWMAIRDSETAAVSSGISLAYYKTLAFAVSAFYAGIAGSLFVINNAYVDPDSYSLALSLTLLIGVVIGGLANVWGPLLGAMLVVWLPYYAEKSAGMHLGPISLGGKPDIEFGIVLLLIVFFAPSGLAGLISRAMRWYAVRRAAGRGTPVAPETVPDVLGDAVPGGEPKEIST